jgi:hypothetical protein
MMGFTLADDLLAKVTEMALSMGESQEALVIPDSCEQVLVRAGSKAFLERKGSKGIFMIPVQLKTVTNGVEKQELFFVCTQ